MTGDVKGSDMLGCAQKEVAGRFGGDGKRESVGLWLSGSCWK